MDSYCVGPTMAVDWGADDKVEVNRPLLRRVFGYFLPHRGRGLLVVACIAVGAALGLGPAIPR